MPLLLFLLTALAITQVGGAQTVPAESLRSKMPELEKLVTREMRAQKIPGLSLAVGVDGAILHARGYGLADVEGGVAVTMDTRFRTASIAKPLTAVAVMQLAEQERLDLDADIRDYCPEFPAKKWPVTTRQLLAHLGGVRHYKRRGEASGTKWYPTLKQSMETFGRDPLVAEPGTKYNYTTYGYTLLGRAVETVSGMPFETYMVEKVFVPGSMHRTVVDSHFRLVPHRARGYVKASPLMAKALSLDPRHPVKPDDVVNATLHDTSMKVHGGGLLSTAQDLVEFGHALLEDRLVKPETRRVMWTEQKTRDGKGTSYGLGFGLRPGRVQHSGGQAGTACFLVIEPETRLVVAAMTNLQGADVRKLVSAVRKHLQDRKR